MRYEEKKILVVIILTAIIIGGIPTSMLLIREEKRVALHDEIEDLRFQKSIDARDRIEMYSIIQNQKEYIKTYREELYDTKVKLEKLQDE